MFRKVVISAVLVSATVAAAQTVNASASPIACSAMSLGTNGALNGFVPSPGDAWHQDITNAAIDPKSATIIATSGDLAGAGLHPDFSNFVDGGYGIPYTVVDSSKTPGISVPILLYPDDSDLTLYPVPADLPVEGSPADCPTSGDDRHAIIIDRNQCVAYEMWQAAHCKSQWTASAGTLWDFTKSEQRPYGLTSVDAAGLSVFEGLIRYDEIVAGVINHAIRFTAQHTKNNANNGYFTAPATHAAGNNWATNNIIGMRIRLKANFDISKFSSTNQVILRAMKQYGMILADNGSNLFFQGTPDARWDDNDLSALKAIKAASFDVVQMGAVYDASTAPKGAAPVITSFTASATTVASGSSVTLTPVVTGASYSYIDNVGFVRGAVTVAPTATTTYQLSSRNSFGTATASVTVTVTAATAGTPNLQFAAIANKVFGAAPFAVSAGSASAGAVTYAVVSGPATVSGSTVTLTGAGTVTLKASQAAAANYSAASVQTSFAVAPGDPALTFAAVGAKSYGSAPFTVSTTTQSAGSISYAVVSGPASVSGNVVTLTGAGTVTLQASEAASGNYAAATATTSFIVNAAAAVGSFTIAATNLTVASGSAGAATVTVTPLNGYKGTVAMSVSASAGLTDACYSISNDAVSGTAPVSTVLTVYTTGSACTAAASHGTDLHAFVVQLKASNDGPERTESGPVALAFLGLLTFGALGLKSRRLRPLMALCLVGIFGMMLSGCGSGSVPVAAATAATAPRGTYAFTLTGTDMAAASITSSTSFTLVIQ